MSQTSPTPHQRMVTELKVSAHLMLLDPGVFCIFHGPGNHAPDAATGLPGVRVTRSPSTPAEALDISTFNPDGWLGGENGAALVRVKGGQAQMLVTIYQAAGSTQEAPKLQVLRLSEQAAAAAGQDAPKQAAQPAGAEPPPAGAAQGDDKPEVAAHVQRRGDLLTRIGDWMGERGSQNWIEGFAIQPSRLVEPADVEYQAVLGKGWLSPWAEGGKYCGSRGMALPILGLRVRLKGEAAKAFAVRIHASFIDGSAVGPVDGSQTAETESLAPLEAFKVEFVPLHEAVEADEAEDTAPAPAPAAKLAKAAVAAPARQPVRAIQSGAHPSAKASSTKAAARPGKSGRLR